MNTRSFLKGLIYFCLALTPFLAWYVSNQTFFPFITGKNFAFRTLIEIAFAAYVVLAYIEPSYRPKKSVVLYTYTTFLVALLISNILGSNTYLSLFSNYERMEGWFTHLHIFLYFIILYSVYKSEHDWTKIFGWFMVSGIAVITEGLFQLFGQKDFFLTRLLTNNFVTRLNEAYPTHMGGGLRLDSSLGNAAYYGIYTLFFVFISLILAFKVNKWKGKQNYIPMFWVLLGAVMVLGQNLLNSYAVALAASAQTLASNLSSFANFLSLLGWVVIIVSGISFVKALSKNEIGSWPLALFSFVSIVSLVYTQTRGSYVGLVGGIIVAGLIYVFADRER
ncbi:MAG: hypothetical protein QG614_571, partial [Patescibacteria group bacterium]|nr:hypothetical protein [Patescibacteria group bacterium]